MHKILSFYEFNTFDFLDVKENQKNESRNLLNLIFIKIC